MTSLACPMSDADVFTVPVVDPGKSAWEAPTLEAPIEWKVDAKGRNHSAELFFPNEPPTWAAQALGDFIELLELPEGWNSYGARPVDEATVRLAVDVLFDAVNQLTPRPAIVPTAAGGVQIEWHMDTEVEVEIHPNGTITFLGNDEERDFENLAQAIPVIRSQIRQTLR